MSDLKVAFEMLDMKREGMLDRVQSRNWLRCAGWCLNDEELDMMLNSAAGVRGVERQKWGLKHLLDVVEQNRSKENSSVDELREALRRLANNRGKITRETLLANITQDQGQGLTEADFDQVLMALGLEHAKLLDCDQ